MPHHPTDEPHLHLTLIREDRNPQRRKKKPHFAPPLDRGGRAVYGPVLTKGVEELERQAQAKPQPPPGVSPHLVFRVPIAPGASSESLEQRLQEVGISIVGVERDGAIIAFHDDANLAEFRGKLEEYTRGPKAGIKTTKWDVFELIEADRMRLWSRADRVGRRLAESAGPEGRNLEPARRYVLDVELWHRGTAGLAQKAIDELICLINDDAAPGEALTDRFIGETLCLARVRLPGAKLDRLLEMDTVAEVDFPPVPVFDAHSAREKTARDFPSPPRPPDGGPRVCVLDSGVASNHPLIANNLGHAESILTLEQSAADGHGHGSMVGGLAVFGDIRACYEDGLFSSNVTLYSARVLNDENRFDDEKLIIEQMRRAIEMFKGSPYDCRVFNLSLGDGEPWLRNRDRQSLWAECLDCLAREEKVLIVVSAGNQHLGAGKKAQDAERALADYPEYLFEPDCGLCDPATAAIAITVGGIAQHDVPGVRKGRCEEDIVKPVARADEPLSTTRIGPGLDSAIKPEFVAYSGNWVFGGFDSTSRSIRADSGVAVMSLSHEPAKSLFSFDVGTSFAAPLVSRLAAILWDRLRETLGDEPDPNLVRAVLASAASPPPALVKRIEAIGVKDGVRRVCGYGLIDEELALRSWDSRVTLIAQSSIPLDGIQIYEVPAPKEFRYAQGKKRVVVSLAFDPPVRRRRAKYFGVGMSYALIRGKPLDQIEQAYRALTTADREKSEIPAAPKTPYRCKLDPGPTALASSTLQRSEWTFEREQEDYGASWYLVVSAQRNWAPDEVTHQDYAVAVSLEAKEPQLYALVEQRVQARQRERLRARH